MQRANTIALNNLAYALAVHLGKPAEALPHARRAMSLAPRVASIVDTLGWTEYLLGNHEVASNLLTEAIRLEPEQAEIRLHAAIVYAAMGRREQSQAELDTGLSLPHVAESAAPCTLIYIRLSSAGVVRGPQRMV